MDMDIDIENYISLQPLIRQNILAKIHKSIVAADKSVKAEIGKMMGKEMIIYKGKGHMKYGLASVKNYMSFHVMPIYGSKVLYSKYKTLLPKANFQKGCINFRNEDEMPVHIVQQLIIDCSTIDLLKMKEEYLESKRR
jgi:hypothetical protein